MKVEDGVDSNLSDTLFLRGYIQLFIKSGSFKHEVAVKNTAIVDGFPSNGVHSAGC